MIWLTPALQWYDYDWSLISHALVRYRVPGMSFPYGANDPGWGHFVFWLISVDITSGVNLFMMMSKTHTLVDRSHCVVTHGKCKCGVDTLNWQAFLTPNCGFVFCTEKGCIFLDKVGAHCKVEKLTMSTEDFMLINDESYWRALVADLRKKRFTPLVPCLMWTTFVNTGTKRAPNVQKVWTKDKKCSVRRKRHRNLSTLTPFTNQDTVYIWLNLLGKLFWTTHISKHGHYKL